MSQIYAIFPDRLVARARAARHPSHEAAVTWLPQTGSGPKPTTSQTRLSFSGERWPVAPSGLWLDSRSPIRQIRVRRRWRGTSVRFHLLFIRMCLNEAASIDSLRMPSSVQIILLLLCVEMVADLLFSFPNLDYYSLLLSLFTLHCEKKPTKNPTRTQIQSPIIRSACDIILTDFFSLYHIIFSLFYLKLMSCVLFTFFKHSLKSCCTATL